VNGLNAIYTGSSAQVVVAPPSPYLTVVRSELRSQANRLQGIAVAAQNIYLSNGAYTGEISPQMCVDLGVQWVLVGHSEVRVRLMRLTAHVDN
jgi:triosephosphate isomerase